MLQETIDAIRPVSAEARAAAEERQAQLTKPAGSLGLLETIGNQLAAIAGTCPPPVPERAVVGVFAGDHGVCAQGVTPWPQDVTVAMLMNMAAGGAAINVLSRELGATTMLTDVGVAGEHPAHDAIRAHNVARGTRDMTEAPAMTADEARRALEVGIATANEAVDGGAQVLLTGDMGIGNTTPSAALVAGLTGADPGFVTGRGTGIDDTTLATKVRVITEAIALHEAGAKDPLRTLAAVGGLEHAALAGFILGGAARGVPVILDGVIACSSALVAVALAPEAQGYLIAGHAGAEPGIKETLKSLGLTPLVDLGLRLGEGSGAVLALPLVRSAARILGEMATFADAGIEA